MESQMKKIQKLVLLFAAVLMGYSSALRADDTDIYVDNAATNGKPNVLFVIDTGANFSSVAPVPCTTYASGGAPSLGNTAGGIEQCALVDTIEGLADSSVNIGILVNNNNNFGTDVRQAGDPAYHETCMGSDGGCVIRKLTTMNTAGKASLVSFIRSWKMSNVGGVDPINEFVIKSGGDRTASTMQEAWAYYNGKIGMSGKDYANSILGSGCQKNFIIFIGNSFTASGGPADGGNMSPFDGAYGMTAAQTAATAAQKIKISERVDFNPSSCGVTSIAATTAAANWSENWADEWARLMNEQDGGTTQMESTQNIKTYTVGVVNDASCKPDYPALLTTMAKYGGGKYFKTSNSSDLKVAMQTILNEVQAVNSVFSSASLPVSVNAEGSYLNQIYLGMFRPDSSAAPRWLGNLKQYHLVKNESGVLVLGDKNNNPAISSSGTGFISPNAVSFWSNKDESTLPDSAGGFWVKDQKGIPKSGFDSPDGEVVEKGGVAQQIRLENLTADFSSTEGGSSNPRRLFTYCPDGTTCNANLTNSSNAFSTANLGIPATAFGSSTTLPVVSIVRPADDPTSAVVTTSGAHGFTTGTTVTITNAAQSEYNVTQAVTYVSPTSFKITGFEDLPTSPSAGTYTVSAGTIAPVSVTSMSRTTSTTGGNNFETVTVTTSAQHNFTTSSNIVITGAYPTEYNRTGTPATVPDATSFTFNIAIKPNATAQNSYGAQLSPAAYPPLQGVSLSNPSLQVVVGSSSTAHKLHVGQVVSISLTGNNRYNTSFTVTEVISPTQFKLSGGGSNLVGQAAVTGRVTPRTDLAVVIQSGYPSRQGTTNTETATVNLAAGAPAGWFGAQTGDTKIVNIVKTGGTNANEGVYAASNVTITCSNTGCTQFTFPITVTPANPPTGSIVAGLAGASSAAIPVGAIDRHGTATATVTLPDTVADNTFADGQALHIVASTPLGTEAAYVGQWTISCTAPCKTFTFGPVQQYPATPATGAHITAYSESTPPNKDSLIRWVRGEDNFGDEKGPRFGETSGPLLSIKVRPSVHGDVLHSRPLVVNYGDAERGIVVFYGANDGIYRAINGNQTGNINSVPPGGELWGLVLPEHYGLLNRQRLNSPELRFPSTTLESAQPKNYFVDGPTAAYQRIDADGKITKAIIYLTMRRGGRFLYAIDVTQPATPTVLWRRSNESTDYDELGQTWSRPRAVLLDGGGLGTTPVLVFGGGYDPNEDSEPPTTTATTSGDSMGRAIYIVDAMTGDVIWQASASCTASASCKNVPEMKYAIPSDVTFVDRNLNGKTDKIYVGDLGGNIWRVDVADADKSAWTVTKLAALGCAGGACAGGTTPRKFFFPPAVLSIKPASDAGAFDAVSIPSGDREHPLKSTATGSAYNVNNKFFMINDRGVTSTPVTQNVTLSSLFNATSTPYNGELNGFYINFATGEKGVNAPLATNGQVFFATNRPVDKSATCAANLGEAKAYAVSPFSAEQKTSKIDGGGLPPSPVSGLITITDPNHPDDRSKDSYERFCIGCAANCTGSGCSALENSPPPAVIPKDIRRTYWYRK
jgi:type IV pilus assembly protein PilY1